jgi:hypothetical protein
MCYTPFEESPSGRGQPAAIQDSTSAKRHRTIFPSRTGLINSPQLKRRQIDRVEILILRDNSSTEINSGCPGSKELSCVEFMVFFSKSETEQQSAAKEPSLRQVAAIRSR